MEKKRKKWIKIWPHGQNKPTSPPFIEFCVIVHISPAVFVFLWRENIQISECWHFLFGNKEQKQKNFNVYCAIRPS